MAHLAFPVDYCCILQYSGSGGLPGPPDDSLKVPRDVGLPAIDAPGPYIVSGWLIPGLDSFHSSEIKLPTIICKQKQTPMHQREETSGKNTYESEEGQFPLAS